MKSFRICRMVIVLLAIFVITFSGCTGKTKKAVQKQTQIEKPAVDVESPVPAVENPQAVPEKPAPTFEKQETTKAPAVSAKTVPMVLKFSTGEITKYKVIMEGQRKVKWDGAVPNKPSFQSGETRNKAEMTFTQKIQSVTGSGNAFALITIDQLKYVSSIKETQVLDFDSSRAEDTNTPMARLIGQSYTIEITPSAEVAKVVDVNSALAAVKGDSSAQRAAMRLLEPEIIRERHGTLRLPSSETQLTVGAKWKNTKTFSYGWMGSLTYERIYTLKDVEDHKATVDMEAVPATEPNNPSSSRLAKNFDHKGRYWGQLHFDTAKGEVTRYSETIQEDWLVAKPSEEQGSEGEPTALTMSASRFYSIEKIE